MRCVLRPVLASAAALLLAPTIPVAEEPQDWRRLLAQAARFSVSDLGAVERGQPVARVLDTERSEVAVAGAVRIRAPRERILERYRDVSLLARSEMVLQVGRFSATPIAEDLREVAFEPYDLESLRNCEPGDCAVRFPADALARFRQSVNWRSPDWQSQAASAWRQVLAGYAADYRSNGDRALAEYHNKEEPLRLRDQFAILYRESTFVTSVGADILRYLQEYPRLPSPAAEDVLYWSKDDFGLRPVLNITHLSIHSPSGGSASGAAVVGTKQIYATHYFDGALGMTVAMDDHVGGSYMIVINRARTRSLTSRLRGFVRGIVQRRSRDALETVLRSTKASIELAR